MAHSIQRADLSLQATWFLSAWLACGTLIGFSAPVGAQVYQLLHEFSFAAGAPFSGLVQDSNGRIYGTLFSGGASDKGAVFSLTPDVSGGYSFLLLHEFRGPEGALPSAALIQAPDGYFYGTTSQGGVSNEGTVYRIDSSGNLRTLHSFIGSDGSNPESALIQARDGTFYGTTSQGGAHGGGTVFRMDSSGNLTTIHHFDSSEGGAPYASLVEGSDGYFYGTTTSGGATPYGTVFRIDSSGTLTTLHDFVSPDNGAVYPDSLMQASDGYLYGTTIYGGTNDLGSLFRIDASGNFTVLHSFSGDDGLIPHGPLIEASDGNFYGTTERGFWSGGSVFRLDLSGQVTPLHNFGIEEGYSPKAGLIQDRDGRLYGTLSSGGQARNGTVFQVDFSGHVVTLHHFASDTGAQPSAELIEASDGYIYGSTFSGGSNNRGIIFKMNSLGELTVVHSFNASEGAGPFTPIEAGDGNFYGVTRFGVDLTSYGGTVFKMDRLGNVTTLHQFTGSDGSYPMRPLIQGRDGYLYGTTNRGGLELKFGGYGTIFRIDTSGQFETLYRFNGTDGAYPNAPLVQASDKSFYGTTWGLGEATIFKIDSSGNLTVFHTFGAGEGWDPSKLIQGSAGDFYGTANSTVFKIDVFGQLTVLHRFIQSEGANAGGGVIQGSDGNFYGTTCLGGSHGFGTVFQMDASGRLRVLHDFGSTDGQCVDYSGPLIQASDGALYGTTRGGGSGAAGVLFRLPCPSAAASNNGPFCSGESLLLSASTIPSATYSWTGPNGFSSSLQNPTIYKATTADSGTYTVTVTARGCAPSVASTSVTVLPQFSASISTDAWVCADSFANAASVPDAGPGARYYWSITNGAITGGQGTPIITFDAGPSGSVDLGVYIINVRCSAGGSRSIPIVKCVGAGFYTVTPCRLLDTRNPDGPYGGPALAAEADRTFVFANKCGIPPDATAVSVNVAVVNPTDGPGFLTLYPGGTTLPLSSTINYKAGQSRANNAIITLGPAGDVLIHCEQGGGTAHVVVDTSGYFN